MSTVPEALTAAHCGMKLLGISMVTNMAAGITDTPITVEDVAETAEIAGGKLAEYVKKIVAEL